MTRNLILATAGHVDHGKTALVKALTGVQTDRLPEEKKRGITIDLGFAHLALPGFSLGVIDVPGHEDFIRNMIAGIGSIDLALLVVAADDGWMAQTEEHLQILDYLAVAHGVVAITKSDLSDAKKVSAVVREQLKGSSLGNAPIVPTSVKNGNGLDLLSHELVRVCAAISPLREIGKARLFVDRAFTIRGSGTVVTGTLSGGQLSRGETVALQPQNLRARIRTLQSHNQSQEIAVPGTRTALNLPDLQPNEIPRGSVLTTMDLAESSRTLDVLLMRSPRSASPPLKNLSAVQLHYGSVRQLARVTLVDRRELAAGEQTIARLRLAEPVFAFLGDRFILRDSSARRTIAGGVILDADAEGTKFRSSSQRDFLKARAAAPNDLQVLLRSQLQRDRIAPKIELLLKSNFSAGEIEAALQELIRGGDFVECDAFVVASAWWRALVARATKAIDAAHTTRPNEIGADLSALRAGFAPNDAPLFESLLRHLSENGFERVGKSVRRRTHRPSLPRELQSVGSTIRAALLARRFDPPSRKELAPTAQAQEALRFLCDTGEVLRLSDDVVLSASAFAEMKERVTANLRARGAASTSELRQMLGTTRRILVPLLEHFDRIGLTNRQGDRRSLR
jgi:selenocysteine-specific elongation factor